MNNYYQRPSPFGGMRNMFSNSPMMLRLVLINLGVWVTVIISGISFKLFGAVNPMIEWMAVPASIESLITRPWTVFTYMFLHEGFLHIFFNMLLFVIAARLFEQFLGSKKLLWTYLIGGLTGALIFIVSYNTFPVLEPFKQTPMLGASASVLAVLVAIAFYKPNHKINFVLIGPVKLKYVALILFFLDLININSGLENVSMGNVGGHLAHLGGALWGLIYIQLIVKKGLFNRESKKYTRYKTSKPKKDKKKARMKAKAGGRPKTDEQFNYEKAEKQKRVDAILDKIARSGYESLTKEEKEILFRESNK